MANRNRLSGILALLGLTATALLVWSALRGIEFFIGVATALSAIGTCAAAVVVAFQTFFTRRAVEETARATDVSKRLMAEAVKTRLDARAPHISVVRVQDVLWPPFEPSDFGEAQPLPRAHEFHLPRDGQGSIEIRLHLSITNYEGWTVRLGLNGIVPAGWDQQRPQPTTAELAAGESTDFYAIYTRTVADWVDIGRDRRTGDSGPEFEGQVIYLDDGDEGVVDTWDVRIGGTPLAPVSEREGVWVIVSGPRDDPTGHSSIDGLVLPRRREYYLSRRNNVRLELPAVAGL